MSNTIPDLVLPNNQYVDVYSLTGISPGSSLILNNKSASIVYIQVRASQPAATSTDGWPLRTSSADGSWTTVTNVPTGSRVWVRGTQGGKIFVQLFED